MLRPTPENIKANAERMGMLMEWIEDELGKISPEPKAYELQNIADLFGHFKREIEDAEQMMSTAADILREREERAAEFENAIYRVNESELKKKFEEFMYKRTEEEEKGDEGGADE